jgi:uracil-DNA glycosylase
MDAVALLRLQIEWGADEALEDAPVDRLRARREGQGDGEGHGGGERLPLPLREGGGGRGLARSLPMPDPSPQPPPSRGGGVSFPAPASTPAAHRVSPPGTPAERAASAAGQARSIDDLRVALAAFDGCALRDTAANLVFAAGDPDADLMLIGEPPGEAEDRSGTPFAGPDGVLLDRMLASVGLARDGLLLTPLIPWRPPGGRLPNPAEITLCLPFLHRLIALVEPRRVVLAGALAARTLLGPTRRRPGPAWIELQVPRVPAPIPALVMPGPAMVARTPGSRRDAWAALRLLRRTLDSDLAKT